MRSKRKLGKIISKIENLSYSEYIYFTLPDYPLELWYGPCDINFYNIMYEYMDQAGDFDYWEFTYKKNSNEILKFKYLYTAYLKINF